MVTTFRGHFYFESDADCDRRRFVLEEISVMRISFVIAAIVVLAAATTSTLAQKVSTEFDPGADFSKYKTYTWKEGKSSSNPAIHQRVIAGVEKQLAAHGFTRAADPEKADLIVEYSTAAIADVVLNTQEVGTWSVGYGYWPVAHSTMVTSATHIRKGSLVLDLADPATKHFIWRGIARATVSDDVDKVNKTIDKALAKLFKDFPPKR